MAFDYQTKAKIKDAGENLFVIFISNSGQLFFADGEIIKIDFFNPAVGGNTA